MPGNTDAHNLAFKVDRLPGLAEPGEMGYHARRHHRASEMADQGMPRPGITEPWGTGTFPPRRGIATPGGLSGLEHHVPLHSPLQG